MSIESWKAEFYPIEASKVLKKDAIEHSLRKWIGLRKKNLEKHGCFLQWNEPFCVTDDTNNGNYITINADSCALCLWFMESDENIDDRCLECPLSKIRNNNPCDYKCGKELEPPFQEFSIKGNPEPMIKLIKEAKKKYPKIT